MLKFEISERKKKPLTPVSNLRTYPSARLSLNRCQPLSLRCSSSHHTTFSKSFLSISATAVTAIPCTRDGWDSTSRAYRRRSYASNSALPSVLKVERGFKESVRLLAEPSAGVEELCKGPNRIFRAATSPHTSGLHLRLVCVVLHAFFGLARAGGVFFSQWVGLTDRMYCALRCLPQRCSVRHLRNRLNWFIKHSGFFRRRRPEVEGISSCSGCRDEGCHVACTSAKHLF